MIHCHTLVWALRGEGRGRNMEAKVKIVLKDEEGNAEGGRGEGVWNLKWEAVKVCETRS
jgi:hypothetical protein